MNPRKSLKRIAVRKTVDTIFKAIEKHPHYTSLMKGDNNLFLDIFNTGIVINVRQSARKYYPLFADTLKQIIEKELKKL